MNDTMLTREQVAKMYHIKKETVIAWEKKGLLKPVRLSPHVILHRIADIEAFETAQAAK